MNVRDRQLATLIIWAALFIILALTVPRLLDVQADLTGLWPPNNGGVINSAVDVAQINAALQGAQQRLPELMASAQASIRDQLAVRLPLAFVISLAMILAAAASTWFVWRHAGLEAKLAADLLTFEKAKRRNRIERFVDDLDLDELDDLRARLEYDTDERWRSSSDL